MAAVPKSVPFIDRAPYIFNRFNLGTRFQSWISMLRNMYTVTNEQTDFSLLSNPTVIQNTGGGGNTQFEISASTDYLIDGVAYTKGVTIDNAVPAGANTGAGEFKAITVSLNAAGTVTQTVSAAAAAAPVTPPAVPANNCPICTIQIPASFTTGVTVFLTAWVTNGWTSIAKITETNVEVLPEINV
jgi:hypothetical protein